ncbi:MAG: hypothetical protein HKM93_18620 [Desulfobacteraceae bacterium]|nr:hypothetical protein [Desulfobacteraceae bacterium]
MTKKRNIWISLFFIIGMLLMLTNSCKKDDPDIKKDVVITWANPADIDAGIALSATQLNATADVEGTYVYTPDIGTVLSVGANQNLKVDFTPTDAVNYNTATKTVTIKVTEAITVTDIDGNVYHTITIGTQVWMVENLGTTKYRDGTSIPNVTDNTTWNNLTTGAYCDYKNTPSNSATYGRLYNWYAATDARNIAPTGWHVPTDAEWTTLTTHLGGERGTGGKLKEIGTTHWTSPNTGATNETGFTALPGGFRSRNGTFNDIENNGGWWSTTEYDNTYSWHLYIGYNNNSAYRYFGDKELGVSVRCIKD